MEVNRVWLFCFVGLTLSAFSATTDLTVTVDPLVVDFPSEGSPVVTCTALGGSGINQTLFVSMYWWVLVDTYMNIDDPGLYVSVHKLPAEVDETTQKWRRVDTATFSPRSRGVLKPDRTNFSCFSYVVEGSSVLARSNVWFVVVKV